MQATAPELRPLSVGEVLDVAIKIFARNAPTLFAVVLPIVFPVQLVSSLIEVSAEPETVELSAEPGPLAEPSPGEPISIETNEYWLYSTAIGVVFVLGAVASTLATGACFKAVGDAYLGERSHWARSLTFALRRGHSILWVTFLGWLVTLLAVFACVIPAVWLYVSFAVAVPVLLTENVRGRRALGRSRRLVKGRWWATFGILLLGALLALVVNVAITGVLVAATLVDPDNELVAIVLGTIGGTVASVLTTPFQAAFVAVLYFDLRVRKEGFDLELLAERIGLTRPPEGAFRPAPAAVLPPPAGATGERPPYRPPPPGWKPSPEATPGPGAKPEPATDPDGAPDRPPPPGGPAGSDG